MIRTAAFAAAAVLTLGAATAAAPCHLEAALGVSHETYTAAELLTLRGAVEEGALDVIAAIASGNADDLDVLVALATAEDRGAVQTAALAR
jgi:hypothetical protein